MCDPNEDPFCKPEGGEDSQMDFMDNWHMADHLRMLVTMNMPWLGMIMYTLISAAAAAGPTLFHFLIRDKDNYFAIVDVAALSKYYEWGWWVYWVGNLVTSGVPFLFNIIASFGVITNVNMMVWGIFRVGFGILSFFTMLGFWSFSYYDAEDKSLTGAQYIWWDILLTTALEAWQFVSYGAFFMNWFAGNMAPFYKQMKEESEGIMA